MSAEVKCGQCGACAGACSCNDSTLGGTPPDEILIFPCPLWELADMTLLTDQQSQQAVIAEFEERQIEIVIDYEHQSTEGVEAPAAGWIAALRADQTGLYGTRLR